MTQFEKFIATMKKVLMLDQADLDFGIYRIMNQKRTQIEDYLNNDLRSQVAKAISQNASSDAESQKKELNQLVATLTSAGMNPDDSPKVKELKAKIAQSGNSEDLENEVYSHLATFFNRYYDGGDFISQRRYKKDVYAIPYEGEEVKLHWANADQYYIKTGEYFRNYRFTTDDGKACEFTLREATTEQNNNVAQNNMERRFALCEENAVAVVDDTLHIYFTYELYPKATKQKALIEKAYETVKPLIPAEFSSVLKSKPTESDRNRTLLQKHLNDYVARNTFDYFIHKDLYGFLSRELDFYIKNEILVIDDINARTPDEFLKHLTVIKAIKSVGMKLVTFLASLENYQKRLWLKKKFVVQADYCITLDRVPESLYAEIAANDAQREEWIRLFAIDEIKANGMFGVAYSEPLSVDFLKANPFLVLDTKFFTSDFKHKLLASIDNIDEQCNGLLINSENFQALSLLQEKCLEQIKCIYIDPPYNTGSDGFVYKDSYQHSTWLSLLKDRLLTSYDYLTDDGVMFISIDEKEVDNLVQICRDIFGEENVDINIWIKVTEDSGKLKITYRTRTEHEYLIVCYKNIKKVFFNKYLDERKYKNQGTNPDNDTRGNWMSANISGGDTNEEDDETETGEVYRYTITTPTGINYIRKWNVSKSEYEELLQEGRIHFADNGNGIPRLKVFVNEPKLATPSSIFSNLGTAKTAGTQIENLFGKRNKFSYPKPTELIKRLIQISTGKKFSMNPELKPLRKIYYPGVRMNQAEICNDYVMDFFCGSATTAQSVMELNKEDGGSRKYVLCDMGDYIDKISKARVVKLIYSKDWKDGKPVSREGCSHCFKYMRLEQYEDTLNNLTIEPANISKENVDFYGGYLLGYLLDVETRNSLFNMQWFKNPWNMKLRITRQNETKEETIDVIETFNYLIGLNVTNILHPKAGICTVEGVTRRGERTLVIWRDCDTIDNDALNEFFRKMDYSTRDTEFDRIYVNGDNNLENIRTNEEQWKVVLTEQEFAKRMFEE